MNLNYNSSVFMELIMRINHCMQVVQGRIQLAKKEDPAHFERESSVKKLILVAAASYPNVA